jgi:hypothetical protein
MNKTCQKSHKICIYSGLWCHHREDVRLPCHMNKSIYLIIKQQYDFYLYFSNIHLTRNIILDRADLDRQHHEKAWRNIPVAAFPFSSSFATHFWRRVQRIPEPYNMRKNTWNMVNCGAVFNNSFIVKLCPNLQYGDNQGDNPLPRDTRC